METFFDAHDFALHKAQEFHSEMASGDFAEGFLSLKEAATDDFCDCASFPSHEEEIKFFDCYTDIEEVHSLDDANASDPDCSLPADCLVDLCFQTSPEKIGHAAL